jgi:hypothetical protein
MVTRPEVLALFDPDAEPLVLAHAFLFVPASTRDGMSTSRAQVGAVFLHEPTVAILLPTDLHELSRRRPDIASLRHVLVKFSFMLDRLPPRHAYKSATLTIRLDHPDAVVRTQVPSWLTPDTESTDTLTTELSATVAGLAQLAAQRTRVQGTVHHQGQLPVVAAEKRDRGDFGWRYEAREGAPLLSRIQYGTAVIELPRDVTELTGRFGAEAMIEVPRWGVLSVDRALPVGPPVPFRLALGVA